MNHSCELDGDVAHAETYFAFIAMFRDGPPFRMNDGRYVDRFEKRQGEWRIAYRICLRDWAMTDGRPDMDDLTSFTANRALLSAAEREFMAGGFGSRRDRTDPSYRRPLEVSTARADTFAALKGR